MQNYIFSLLEYVENPLTQQFLNRKYLPIASRMIPSLSVFHGLLEFLGLKLLIRLRLTHKALSKEPAFSSSDLFFLHEEICRQMHANVLG